MLVVPALCLMGLPVVCPWVVLVQHPPNRPSTSPIGGPGPISAGGSGSAPMGGPSPISGWVLALHPWVVLVPYLLAVPTLHPWVVLAPYLPTVLALHSLVVPSLHLLGFLALHPLVVPAQHLLGSPSPSPMGGPGPASTHGPVPIPRWPHPHPYLDVRDVLHQLPGNVLAAALQRVWGHLSIRVPVAVGRVGVGGAGCRVGHPRGGDDAHRLACITNSGDNGENTPKTPCFTLSKCPPAPHLHLWPSGGWRSPPGPWWCCNGHG